MTRSWAVEHLRGDASALHLRPFGPVVVRRVVVMDLVKPALVLGSTQPASHVDDLALAAHDVDLARRRSGGGGVLLVPGQTLWVDVELPRGDELWDDDVGGAFHWLGWAWVGALATFGVQAQVHLGGARETRWSRTVCFGGLGPGEVSADGRKLVGMSQRRTRGGARFQCVVHRRWDPAPMVRLLALDPSERVDAIRDLEPAGAGLDVDGPAVLDALVAHLPT